MAQRKFSSKDAGFSLLEAVVAMVLISSTALALFSWINTNLSTLRRVTEINAQTEATRNALEFMGAVNPMITPRGAQKLGDLGISWSAELVTPVKDGTDYPAGRGLWQFAIYSVNIKIESTSTGSQFDIQTRQIGYKRVRSLSLD